MPNNNQHNCKPINNIMLLAGEASGDQHAAHLVEKLKQSSSTNIQLNFSGMGGDAMRQAGVDVIFDLAKYSVIGASEVIKHITTFKHAFNLVKKQFKNHKPDLLILIDNPGFNLRVAKIAKKHDIKVIYYISPQLWAWKPGRIKTIQQCVQHMAVILPFEVDVYRNANVPVNFVGNPLAETVKASKPVAELKSQFGLKQNSKVIGLMPGSRQQEITRLVPIILESASVLKQRYPDCEFILPMAPNVTPEKLQPYLSQHPDLKIKLVSQQAYDAISCCDAVITASGTATLEIALLGKPMVIIYKVSGFTYCLGRMLVKVKHIGLCNLLLPEALFPEYMQQDVNISNITSVISKYLDDPKYVAEIKTKLTALRQQLLPPQNQPSLADIVLAQSL